MPVVGWLVHNLHIFFKCMSRKLCISLPILREITEHNCIVMYIGRHCDVDRKNVLMMFPVKISQTVACQATDSEMMTGDIMKMNRTT